MGNPDTADPREAAVPTTDAGRALLDRILTRGYGHSALTRVELVTPAGERFILPASSVVVTDEFPKATTVTFTVPARVRRPRYRSRG